MRLENGLLMARSMNLEVCLTAVSQNILGTKNSGFFTHSDGLTTYCLLDTAVVRSDPGLHSSSGSSRELHFVSYIPGC